MASMPTLDRALLSEHARHTLDGVTERAFHIEVGGDRLFALLTEPAVASEAHDLGFVVVHSFGLDVLTLRRSERGVARALAAAGHPVLFVHRRGFGDSEGDPDDATLERQLEDLRAARDHLLTTPSVRRVALVGARFGGLLAGLLAREGGVERLALIQPAVSGAQWTKHFIREMHVVRMADPDGSDRRDMQDLLAEMHRDGLLDVLGYGLPAVLHDALQGEDLTSDMGSFDGGSLIVQVAKRPTLARDLEALRDRLAAAGGPVRIEVVREPAGSSFGSASFVATSQDVNVRTDVMEPVVVELGRIVTEWVASDD
jgi:pimeloyl-ACP methyl ester carboxylesterase